MFKAYILPFVFLFLFACSSKQANKNSIIKKEKFIEILKDFHKTEGLISIERLNRNKKKNDTTSIYNFVLKKHNVSRSDFNNTISYYMNNMEEYSIIYDTIISQFTSIQSKIKDSIKVEHKRMTPQKLFTKKNLWKKKKELKLNKSPKDSIFKFNIKTTYQGEYYIEYRLLTRPKIKNLKDKVKLFANYKDGSKDVSHLISVDKYYKNKKYDIIRVSINTNKNKKLKSISGWIMDFQKKGYQHFHFSDIKIKYVLVKKNIHNKKEIQ